MRENYGSKTVDTLTSKNVTVNMHSSSITLQDDFVNHPVLQKLWNVVATGRDRNGKEFVAYAEYRQTSSHKDNSEGSSSPAPLIFAA